MNYLPFPEQVEVAVGNQLRIARNRYERIAYGLRPWNLFDELMDDLVALDRDEPPWSEQRQNMRPAYPLRKRVLAHTQPPITSEWRYEQ